MNFPDLRALSAWLTRGVPDSVLDAGDRKYLATLLDGIHAGQVAFVAVDDGTRIRYWDSREVNMETLDLLHRLQGSVLDKLRGREQK